MNTISPEVVEVLDQAALGPVRLTHPTSNAEFVVLRAEDYDRFKQLLYDDSDWSDSELRALALRTFEDADSAGPIS